jgi:hypothetical protein
MTTLGTSIAGEWKSLTDALIRGRTIFFDFGLAFVLALGLELVFGPAFDCDFRFVFNAGFVRTFDLDAGLGFTFGFDRTGLVIFFFAAMNTPLGHSTAGSWPKAYRQNRSTSS